MIYGCHKSDGDFCSCLQSKIGILTTLVHVPIFHPRCLLLCVRFFVPLAGLAEWLIFGVSILSAVFLSVLMSLCGVPPDFFFISVIFVWFFGSADGFLAFRFYYFLFLDFSILRFWSRSQCGFSSRWYLQPSFVQDSFCPHQCLAFGILWIHLYLHTYIPTYLPLRASK